MADKPVGEVVAVDAVLDALSSPTSSDVYEALLPYGNDAVAAVAAKRASGASGPQTVYVQDADPGAVGEGKLWIDTTTDPPTPYMRNAADDGWSNLVTAPTLRAVTDVGNDAEGNDILNMGSGSTANGLTMAGNLDLDGHAIVDPSSINGVGGIGMASGATLNMNAGSISSLNNIEIDGALNHDGTTVGFYGGAPIVKQVLDPVTATAQDVANVLLALNLIAAA